MSETRLVVPALDGQPWPSLGGQVCDFIEDHLVFGPGDLLGEPAVLTDEARLFLWRAYEVYPQGHPQAGRRRFKRVVYSRRKGAAKTEIGAWIAICEMDPAAPVRCDGFDANGNPVGRGVRDPYIPMVATTEEQVEDLAYGAVYEILTRSELGASYDVGLERTTHRVEPGSMQPLAGSPSAREGARTTFQHFDEPHLFVSNRLKKAHATMLRNIPKARHAADPWSLETTTMFEPGEDSVAELAWLYALDVQAGRVEDPRLYYDHRQASTAWDLSKRRELLAALKEASGDAWAWTDAETLAGMFYEPGADRQAFKRYYLNQRVKGSHRWVAPEVVERAMRHGLKGKPPEGTECVLAFDGSYSRDSTALVGCTLDPRPYIWVEGAWERPLHQHGPWRVSRTDVEETVTAAMDRYVVRELAPDPPGWHQTVEGWEYEYEDVVVRFETNQPSRMGPAADRFDQGLRDDLFDLEAHEALARHLANCVGVVSRGYTLPRKAAADSPEKIDVAIGAVIAYERACWWAGQDTDSMEPLVGTARVA